MQKGLKGWAVPAAVALIALVLVVGDQLGIGAQAWREAVDLVTRWLPRIVWSGVAVGALLLGLQRRSTPLLWMSAAAFPHLLWLLASGVVPIAVRNGLVAVTLWGLAQAILAWAEAGHSTRQGVLLLAGISGALYLLFPISWLVPADLFRFFGGIAFGTLLSLLAALFYAWLAAVAWRGARAGRTGALHWLAAACAAAAVIQVHSLAMLLLHAPMPRPAFIVVQWVIAPLVPLLIAAGIWREARTPDRGM